MRKILVVVLSFNYFSAYANNLKCNLRKIEYPVNCTIRSWESYKGGWDGEEQELIRLYSVEVRDSSLDSQYFDTNVFYSYNNALKELQFLQKNNICPN